MTNTNKFKKDGQSPSPTQAPASGRTRTGAPVLGKDVAYPESYRLLPRPAKKAFKEGFLAFYRGALIKSCPYLLKNLAKALPEQAKAEPLAKKGMPLIGSWQDGWRFGKELHDSRIFVRQTGKAKRSPSLTVRLREDQAESLRRYAITELRSLNTMVLAMIQWFLQAASVNGVLTKLPMAPDKSDSDRMAFGLQLRPNASFRELIIESAAQARHKYPNINSFIIAIVDEYIRAHPLDNLE